MFKLGFVSLLSRVFLEKANNKASKVLRLFWIFARFLLNGFQADFLKLAKI